MINKCVFVLPVLLSKAKRRKIANRFNNAEYSYWRVSSGTVIVNKAYGGNYEVPGIYCNLNGIECIYECDN